MQALVLLGFSSSAAGGRGIRAQRPPRFPAIPDLSRRIFLSRKKTVEYLLFLRQGPELHKGTKFMVTIRLTRGGAKKRPFYHVVVTDSRSPRDGRFIERLGFYNPLATESEVKLNLDTERLDYWLSQGANPSERVSQLVKQYRSAAAAA
jgi:small subunit ribosomal protein S16